MKDISIIVPFHKGLFYLEECLESILTQELPTDSYEVICLGDSPDGGVVSYIEKFEKKGIPIRYIQWIENKGTGYARNKGIEHAEGEYIYFLDCDDYLMPGCIKNLLLCAKKNDADVVRGDIAETFFKKSSTDIEDINKQCLIKSEKKGNDALLSVMFSKEITVLNMLIKKALITEIHAAFPDNAMYFCDMPFVMDLLSHTDKIYVTPDAVLAKRERNDPIHYPSLDQSMKDDRNRALQDLITAYKEAHSYTDDNLPKRKNVLNRLLCENVISFCLNGWGITEDNAKKIVPVIRHAKKSVGNRFPFLKRCILHSISKGRFGQAKKIAAFITITNKKAGLFGSSIQWFRIIDKIIFRKLPRKKNWVVFESFFGKSYSDSPKYIYEYMREHYGDKYKYIWIIDNPPEKLKKNAKTAKFSGIKHVYYSTRAKYHIYNVRQPGWFKKESDMVFVETWHGTPLKKLAFDLDDVHIAGRDHKSAFYRDTRAWNYLVSANRFSSEVFESAFDIDKNIIIETGYPRNDILYSQKGKDISLKIKKELNIPLDKKVILYAPTWRDNSYYELGKYKFELELDLELLKKELGDEWVILLRNHYHIANRIDVSSYGGFVYNVSDFSDVSLLYLISDVCLTDYSSVFFDYANLKRPLLFYVYDYEEYKNDLRGMYLDMETELPGPLLTTTREVAEAIKNINMYDMLYMDRYNQFYDKYCCFDDGFASKRIAELVFEGKGCSSF